MPIPAPNLNPAFNIVRLSHVEFGVTDLAASRKFYTEILGLQVTDEDQDTIYLRAMEERGHHCLVLKKKPEAGIDYLSYKVWSEEDLDKAEAFFKAKGHKTEWVDRAYQGRTLRTHDCFGAPMEFYYKMDRLEPLRIDHFNCFAPNVDQAVEFYGELGFRVTEYTEDEETGHLWAAWAHRKGGVHDIAFTNGTGPRLHHTAFWVPTPLNIIDLLDLMATTGYVSNIERGPGRHGISNAFFLYILDPDGHRIEIYCSDYQTVDPDLEPIKWDLKDPQRQTLWGAAAPRSWFEHGSVFTGVATREAELKATPIIAP